MDKKRPTGTAGSDAVGREIWQLAAGLFPLNRSITGDGLRRTLGILKERIPLEIHEVPTGTRVLDWTVPKEWNIRDAYVRNAVGEKVVDFRKSNLHIVGYSVPVHRKMPLAELEGHLHSLPVHPDWIPYRTSYYREDWGFCLSHNSLLRLEDGEYDVVVDSVLEDGSLTYGELLLEGKSEEEILISAHTCHPSLANDNLSGIGVAVMLAERLSAISRKYSYRFLFAPGTIGAITWLARNERTVGKIRGGLVLCGLGDPGGLTYKKSRQGNAPIDQAAAHVLARSKPAGRVLEFSPYGYDERQYGSPGFDLPVGRLSRTPFGEYPEYHTSADDLDFVKADFLEESFEKALAILDVLERDGVYVNLSPKGEPQLGRRGLYASPGPDEMALLWVLNQSDGSRTLLDIAERSGLAFAAVRKAADALAAAGLLAESPQRESCP